MEPRTVTELPTSFSEAHFFSLTQRRRLVALNMAAVGILIVALGVFFIWLYGYHALLDGPLVIHALPDNINQIMGLILALLIVPLHEWFHGLGMTYYGHPVRYGVKWRKGVVYATTDNGLFWRQQFIVVSLAPLVGISLILVFISMFTTAAIGVWLMFAASLNAAGAIGDLWMVQAAYRYPANALIRDEEDGMRVFVLSS